MTTNDNNDDAPPYAYSFSGTSLVQTVRTATPAAVEQLSFREQFESPPRSAVYTAVREYLYNFLQDPVYAPYFEPFVRLDAAGEDTDGVVDDDDETPEAHRWTLRTAQAACSQSDVPGEYSPSRKGKLCGHVFREGENVYRCKECSLDDTCVQCAKCFRASDHDGHEVSFSMHSGGCGCCDCGDVEAWRTDVKCGFHHPHTPYPESSDDWNDKVPSVPPIQDVPEEVSQYFRLRIQEVLHFIIEVLSKFPRESKPPADAKDILHRYPAFPERPDPTSPANAYNYDFDKDGWIGFTPGIGPWTVILHNDEKHSYEQVVQPLVSSLQCSRQHAYAAASRVDHYGLEAVATSTNVQRLNKIAKAISAIELAVTICATRDLVMLETVGLLIDWLRDFVSVKIGGDEAWAGRLLAQVFLHQQYNILQKLLYLEDRLWKRARGSLRRILMSLLVIGSDVKLLLGRHYANVYPSIMSSYLLTDREPDNTVTQFTVQLFSSPSIAVDLVDSQGPDFLKVPVEFLYSFFTQQFYTVEGDRKVQMPPSYLNQSINPESSSFKHKRYYHLFSDLGHLLSHPGVQERIANNLCGFNHITELLALFDRMNPLFRAATQHVEYENDSWVAAFNLTIQLSKLAKHTGKAFQRLPVPEVKPETEAPSAGQSRQTFCAAISEIYRKLHLSYTKVNQLDIATDDIHFAGKTFPVIRYDVSSQPISLHHPLHLLLAEMLKNLYVWSGSHLSQIAEGVPVLQPRRGLPWHLDRFLLLRILDEIPRTLAMLAQMRAGLWVRNGFSIRAQYVHYRELNLREFTYDQDIFLLQASFVLLDPEQLLVTLIQRFDLRYTLETGKAGKFDESQTISMMEELLYTLIVVFSEGGDVEGAPIEAVVRRELIHALLLGPLSYSELLKVVTERVHEDACFDAVLATVATFRPPNPTVVTSDVGGVYVLKRECYPEADPYYYRYGRNQREEAMGIKQTADKTAYLHPPVIKPAGAFASQNTQEGTKFGLLDTLGTTTFLSLLAKSMHFAASSNTALHETIIDLVLQLTLIAIAHRPQQFCIMHAGCAELIREFAKLEIDERVKDQHARISHILDTMNSLLPSLVGQYRKSRAENGRAGDNMTATANAAGVDAQRAAAKARQAAIMQKFAAAQKSLMADMESSDEDEDDKEIKVDADQSGDASMIDATADTTITSETRKKVKTVVSAGSCIMCQEDLNSLQPFGSLVLIQTSSLIRLSVGGSYVDEISQLPTDLDRSADDIRPFGMAGIPTSEKEGLGGVAAGFPRQTKPGLFASSCGHMMHSSCFSTYCKSITHRHSHQSTRNHPENPQRMEFICPLCKSLGNVLLPLAGGISTIPDQPKSAIDVGDWLNLRRNSFSSQVIPDPDGSGSDEMPGQMKAWQISPNLSSAIDSSDKDEDEVLLYNRKSTERNMIQRFLKVVAPLDAERHFFDAGATSLPRMIPHELLHYTVAVTEIGLRGKATGTLGPSSLPEPTSRLICSLFGILKHLLILNNGSDAVGHARARLMKNMTGDGDGLFLEKDPLTALIEIVAVSPENFYYAAIITFYSHLLRVAYALSWAEECLDMGTQEDTALAEFAMLVSDSRATRLSLYTDDREQGVWRERTVSIARQIHAHALPFLRRVALIHAALFPAIQPPSDTAEDSEFIRLLSFLKIPHPRQVWGRKHGKQPEGVSGLQGLLEYMDSKWLPQGQPFYQDEKRNQVKLEHPVIYELLGLPRRLDQLIESTSTRRCNNCKTVPQEPAICLICGELVCQQSFCCSDRDDPDESYHGECNTHMWTCGSSMGIYLLVRKCAIIYLFADKGSFATAPYLDAHGESDLGLRKRRPLFLSAARYEEIRKQWLSHSVATTVARRLESSHDSGGWATF